MKKRSFTLILAAIMAVGVCNCVFAATSNKSTAKTAVKTEEKEDVKTAHYNYDWDISDCEDQFTWTTANGDKVYISGDTMVCFNNNGRQTNKTKFSLAGYKPAAYFTEGKYHYFLTGKIENNRLQYRLNKVDEYGHVKMAEASVKCNSDFEYRSAFSETAVRYSWDSRTAVFEVRPDADDKKAQRNEKEGYLRRSPIVYFAFDLARMVDIDDSKEFTKNSALKMNMYQGRYDSTPYAAKAYDFVLGGCKQSPVLFFNGTQLDDDGIVHIDEPQNYGDNAMFKKIYDSPKAGLFIITAPTKGSGRPLAFNSENLIVQADNNKNSLIVGDIVDYGDAVVTTGKDTSPADKKFKNACISYYNTETKTSKKTYLTQYKTEDNIKVGTPYAFTYDKYGIITWYETDKSSGTTVIKWAKLKKSGGIDGDIKTVQSDGIVPVRPLINNVYIYYVTKDADGIYKVNTFKYK